MGAECIEYKTTSAPISKQIDINSLLSTSYQWDLTTDSGINELDAPLSSIITVLWGYEHGG